MRLTRSGNRRVKIIIASLCVAPLLVGAVVTVASGGAGPDGRLLAETPVDPSPGAGINSGEFDELTMIVPQRPGVDGRIGSDKPAKADVPVQGALDAKTVVRPGRAGALNGIPRAVYPAYRRATANLAVVRPDCNLTWPLLAGIGKVESNHAAGGRVDVLGTTRGRILGPVLNGKNGTGLVLDTDDGRYDRDTFYDRPVGPMQIIPSVWAEYGSDGNGDGYRNPNNVYDAVTAVAVLLCSDSANLKSPKDLVKSLLKYHHSKDFVATVLKWMRVYARYTVLVPNKPGQVPAPKRTGNAERRDDPRVVPDVKDDKPPVTATPRPTLTADPRKDQRPEPTVEPTDEPVTPDPIDPRETRPTMPTTSPRPRPTPTTQPTPTPSNTPTSPTPTPTPSDTPDPTPTVSRTPTETGSPVETGPSETATPVETTTSCTPSSPDATPEPTPCGQSDGGGAGIKRSTARSMSDGSSHNHPPF